MPLGEPLEEWQDERLIEIGQAGLSRHVVRFVADGEVRAEVHQRNRWLGASTGY